jgi:hypothetical protein
MRRVFINLAAQFFHPEIFVYIPGKTSRALQSHIFDSNIVET